MKFKLHKTKILNPSIYWSAYIDYNDILHVNKYTLHEYYIMNEKPETECFYNTHSYTKQYIGGDKMQIIKEICEHFTSIGFKARNCKIVAHQLQYYEVQDKNF